MTICLYCGSFERHFVVESPVLVASGIAKGSMVLARWLGEARKVQLLMWEGAPSLDHCSFNSSISEAGDSKIDVPEHSF